MNQKGAIVLDINCQERFPIEQGELVVDIKLADTKLFPLPPSTPPNVHTYTLMCFAS